MSRPVLLIAGGSRGIGAATAKLAAGQGYDVAVNYKNNSNAAASVVEAVEKAGGKAIAIQGDMALENDIERRVRHGERHFRIAHRISCTVPGLLEKARVWTKSARRQSAKYSTSTRSERCSVCAPAFAACRPNTAAKAARL